MKDNFYIGVKFKDQDNLRDGSGLNFRFNKKILKDEEFSLIALSHPNETFIASGFNTYIVKLK